jgi:hypothetical protein
MEMQVSFKCGFGLIVKILKYIFKSLRQNLFSGKLAESYRK